MKFKCVQAIGMLCLVFSFSQTVSAKVWRVNNNAGVSRDFAEVSTAVANAVVQNGDTLYVEGSPTAYTSVTLTKRLVIIGTGYFLSENTGLQANVNDAFISSITLDSLASGSKFYGIHTTVIYTNSNTDDITISRCKLQLFSNTGFVNSKLANWVVSKCYISGAVSLVGSSYVFENFEFTNCIVSATFSITGTLINGLLRNNVFLNTVATNNCYVANNIFLSSSPLNFTNCTLKYNIAQGSVLPAGNNNQNNISQASLFTLTGSTDGKYQLKAGSPAVGAGEPVSGITPDCGAFGTADPYRLSGIPPIPTIYALTVPASVPSTATSMNITVSTRSNN
jgi:hypothetical protein